MVDSMIPDKTTFVIPLNSEETSQAAVNLSIAGGKGANLARLSQAGFPVPGGFIVSTGAYRAFISENRLDEQVQTALPTSAEDLALLEAASNHIRSLFSAGVIPVHLADEILDHYKQMGEPAVAVRSSATAEDLPELSFAGQQDTYLNVVGGERLLLAIVNCWSSLWTARAIGYRIRNQVPQEGAALAVVVQEMVQSDSSGVMFTANPLSGLRSQVVIDATLGLGEALVSGQVEPDHYVVDGAHQGERIIEKRLGSKAVSIRSRAEGGTARMEESAQDGQALPDEQILALAHLGQRVAGEYGFPQDIEWAWANRKLYLLQSRPITSLYPTPEGAPAEPLQVMVSVAAVQGILDPITPLGRDTLRLMFATGAGLFGVRVTPETQQVLFTAGERLWVNITPLVRNSVGRRAVYVALGIVEPAAKQALRNLLDDPQLQPEKRGVSLRAIRRLARFFLPLARNVLLNLFSPDARRDYIVENGEQVLDLMRSRSAAVTGDRYARLAAQADLLPDLAGERLPKTFTLYVSGVVAGIASFNLLRSLVKGLPKQPDDRWDDLVLEVTRSLPHNPTTEMDLTLWEVSRVIRQDPDSNQEFQTYPPDEIAKGYQAGELPEAAQQAVAGFLQKYGGRGLGEFDLGRPRWQEDPTHVFAVLAGYLKIEDGEQAPDAVFVRGEQTAQKAVGQLADALRSSGHLGWLKARLARFFNSRVRALMGIREAPKFFAVRMFGVVRQALLETGGEFVRSGELAQPDDLMYMTFSELKAFAGRQPGDWKGLIAQRREAYQRELLRRQIPRLLLSDGRAFYEGMNSPQGAGNRITGSPVSPGSVEAPVRIVFDPRQAHLLPGEILVCPGTDPSWTPLFLTASGLVMEVGGMMTHGAVVAREYGIPAVVGVDRATTRLKTGQRIYLNGSTGEITLLED